MVKKIQSPSADSSPKTTKATKATRSSKTAGSAPAAGTQASQLAGAVKDSAQHIWLAGMGAFSKAQEGGTKVFEALVKEGQNLQRKTQAVAEEKIGEVTGKMTAMADTVTSKAGQNWDKLESIFETRTAKALSKLGVPTAKDVAALTQRVDELAAAVAKLAKQTPASSANGSAKAAKPVTRKAATPAPAKRAVRKSAKAGASF